MDQAIEDAIETIRLALNPLKPVQREALQVLEELRLLLIQKL